MAVSMMDLTTLEGKDTPGKVAYLCRKAIQPADPRLAVPSCAAVCVYPNLVRAAKKFVGDSGVKVASVATGFPQRRSCRCACNWRKSAARRAKARTRSTW